MKWGVRKDRNRGKSSTNKSKKSTEKERQKARRKAQVAKALRTTARIAITTTLVTSAVVHAYAQEGKQYADSYLKANGNQKVYNIKNAASGRTKTAKSAHQTDHSDWTWADYAWAEIEK